MDAGLLKMIGEDAFEDQEKGQRVFQVSLIPSLVNLTFLTLHAVSHNHYKDILLDDMVNLQSATHKLLFGAPERFANDRSGAEQLDRLSVMDLHSLITSVISQCAGKMINPKEMPLSDLFVRSSFRNGPKLNKEQLECFGKILGIS